MKQPPAATATLEVKLTAEHMAAVMAFERLISSVALEATQLSGVYKQTRAASALERIANQLIEGRNNYVRESQQHIIIPEVTFAPSG
jgi:hypothetical protein